MNTNVIDSDRPIRGQGGQTMLASVLILALLMATIPAVIMTMQSNSRTNLGSLSRNQSMALAQKGISYAAYALQTDTTTWNNAVNLGQFPPQCNSNTQFPSSYGSFTVACSQGPASYQVTVVAKAYQPNNSQPVRALQAVFSQKTLAVHLPTGLGASAALMLTSAPPIVKNTGQLAVHWGPIASWSTNPLDVSNTTMDAQQFPRKFAQGGITGTAHTRTPNINSGVLSDQKEYWAFSSLGKPPAVGTSYGFLGGYYGTQAEYTLINNPSGGSPESACGPGPYPGCTFNFVPITFDSPDGINNYTPGSSSSTTFMFWGMTAVFNRVAFDFREGTLITAPLAAPVGGNLTLDDTFGTSGQILRGADGLRVPPTALMEYPYNASSVCPCYAQAQQAQAQGSYVVCASTAAFTSGLVQIRGFLWVEGSLDVVSGNWAVSGAVRVDGQLTVEPGASLTIYYDDTINHNIINQYMELQQDSVKDIPAT